MNFNAILAKADAYFDDIAPRIDVLNANGINKELHMRNTSNIVVTYPAKQDMDADTDSSFYAGIDQTSHNTLYAHIPFCTGICTYCGFTRTAASARDEKIITYLDLFEEEARLIRGAAGGRRIPVSSIYIGGGTPTMLTVPDLERVFTVIATNFDLLPDGEYTLEGSPETMTPDIIALGRDHGINRVSMGVESFDNTMLASVRRRHDADGAQKAIQVIKDGGIDHIDIDMIRGLPGSDMQTIHTDLRGIERAEVPSVTSYQYVMRPTALDRKDPAASRYDATQRIKEHIAFALGMQALGYSGNRTIVDWFLKHPGYAYRQQIQKWRLGYNLIALGQGAHGHVKSTTYVNHANPGQYRQAVRAGRPPVDRAAFLPRTEAMRRSIIFGLKTGFSVSRFDQQFGDVAAQTGVRDELARFIDLGALAVVDDEYRLTSVGALFADWIQMAFYSPAYKEREAVRLQHEAERRQKVVAAR